MPQITVNRQWAIWYEGDDEPTVVKEHDEVYYCMLDEIDRSDGLTVVDLAIHTLESTLYVDEISACPWRPGSWYSADVGEDYSPDMGGARESLTAHLKGFNVDEERAIFNDLIKRNPHWC